VRTEPLEEILAELRARSAKSAYDYYALAILSDAVAEPEPNAMLRGLLAGLKAFPGDRPLFALLLQVLRGSFKTKEIAAVLQAVAKTVNDDRFYFLTEPLWDRLLAEVPFAEFAKTLKACESALRDHRNAGRLTFWLHILKPALWKADEAWLNDAFKMLQAEESELPPQTEMEVEVLNHLRAYRRQRKLFLNGDPVRVEIDKVLTDYCTLKDFEAERSFLRFQVRLASGDMDIFAAFPALPEPECVAAHEAWCWIESEMYYRLVSAPAEPSDAEVRQVCRSVWMLLQGMEVRGRSTFNGLLLSWTKRLYQVAKWSSNIAMFAVPTVLAFLIAPGFAASYWYILFLVFGVAAFFGGRQLSDRVLHPGFKNYYRELARTCYDTMWRQELQQFLRDRFLPYGLLRFCVENIDDDTLHSTRAIRRFGTHDIALAMTATSLQFLN